MVPDPFTPALRSWLLRPAQWRVTAATGSDVAPVDDPAHAAWMLAHSHSHEHREAVVILAGGGRFGWAGQPYPIGPGSVFLIDPFEDHDLDCPRTAPDGAQLWLSLLSDHAVARVVAVEPGRGVTPTPWRQVLPYREAGLVGWPTAAADAPREATRARRIAALALLVTALVGRQADEDDPTDDSLPARVVESIQQHIARTAGRGVTIEHLARIAGYSPYHFARLFKRHAGCTIHEYVNRWRRERWQQMAAAGHTRRAIAEELGFSCRAAFTRWAKGAAESAD